VSAPPVIYLDYAATTPVDPRVAAAMSACLGSDGDFGNASSGHALGRAAAARIERARAQVAALIGAAADEIVFTSGATESDNLAVLGVARANADRGRHVVTARTEHKAVLDPCRRLEKEGFDVTYLSPDRSGLVPAAAVAAALRPDTQLVSVMGVNNEIGVLQDLAAIGAVCRARGVAFHSDLAQAAGKVPLNVATLPIDIASFTAHKLYGPKGIGALYVRRVARGLLQPLMAGGGQEAGLRPGTLATHQIVGFGVACELAAGELAAESLRLTALRERLWGALVGLAGTHLNGAAAPRVPGILNVSFEGVEGESLVAGLAELAVSTGAACNSASLEASYVLRALGRDAHLAASSLRFSLGRYTSDGDVDRAAAAVCREIARLRALSPAAGSATARSGWAADTAAGGAVVSGEAGGPEAETWVRFHLLVGGDTVKDARVQALGCPHTLDVARWLCSGLPGRRRAGLVAGTPADWAVARAVPVEKLGRLLVVEDALRACEQDWAAAARPASTR
jgi:cysteine desulfurase